MICVSIAPKNKSEFTKLLRCASSLSDLIELRGEFLTKYDLSEFFSQPRPKFIYTINHKSISEPERLKLLKYAIDLKAEFIDIDIENVTSDFLDLIKYARNNRTKIILSYHDLRETPVNLKSIYDKLIKYSPDYIKIVGYANDINDNLKIFKFLKENKSRQVKLISFCMGEKGEISRILAPKFGSEITYTSVDEHWKTAEGQLQARDLIKVYNYYKINPDTKIFGLVGNPVKQSRGIIVHNNYFNKQNLNAVYVNFLVDDFKKFFREYKPLITGLSITKPFKEIATRYIDEASEEVKQIAAVNTIIKMDKKFYGYNSDALALLQLLKNTNISRKTVAVLGTGGAARSAIYAALQLNANLIVFGRDAAKAKKLAEHFKCESDKLANLNKHKFSVLINATSVGMMPDFTSSPVNESVLKPNMLVVDFVYNPGITRLLMLAKSKGCKIINGVSIFRKQATIQRQLFKKVIKDD